MKIKIEIDTENKTKKVYFDGREMEVKQFEFSIVPITANGYNGVVVTEWRKAIVEFEYPVVIE